MQSLSNSMRSAILSKWICLHKTSEKLQSAILQLEARMRSHWNISYESGCELKLVQAYHTVAILKKLWIFLKIWVPNQHLKLTISQRSNILLSCSKSTVSDTCLISQYLDSRSKLHRYFVRGVLWDFGWQKVLNQSRLCQ